MATSRPVNYEATQRAERKYRASFVGGFQSFSDDLAPLLAWKDPAAKVENEGRYTSEDGPTIPVMKGELEFQNSQVIDFEYATEVYAKGVKAKRQDFMNDESGEMAERMKSLGIQMAYTQRLKLLAILLNGFTGLEGLCVDGQFLFDTDHPARAGAASFSNLATGPLSEANFDAAYALLHGIVNPTGIPIMVGSNEVKVHLIVGPENQAVAEKIIEKRINGGNTNPRESRVTVKVIQELHPSNPEFGQFSDMWFLYPEQKAPEMRPVLLAEMQSLEVTLLLEARDIEAFMRDVLMGKVRADWGMIPYAPWSMIGSTGQ